MKKYIRKGEYRFDRSGKIVTRKTKEKDEVKGMFGEKKDGIYTLIKENMPDRAGTVNRLDGSI